MEMDTKEQTRAVAEALEAETQPQTTAQHILSLNELYERAWRRGFADGCVSGSRHTAQAFDLITQAMMPRAPTPHGT